MAHARLAIDIGGTFTDIVVESGPTLETTKVATTPDAPEKAIFSGIRQVMKETGLKPADFSIIIHGTTLATNAIIERKGAPTAMLVTDGFRDAVEIAYENRFEQYDIFMEKPPPLVPRNLRFGITERVDASGKIQIPMPESVVDDIIPALDDNNIEAVAVGLMHSYIYPDHEQILREKLTKARPSMAISLSSEVSPEIREYERWSTTIANAYVQPLMSRYLARLSAELEKIGFKCPLLLMTSGGGLTSLQTAIKFPIRLVESGPAGGAILASHLARENGLERVVSFDMGGTTAKICLIDDGKPLQSRSFEVARQYRYLKGSGLPLRIPVIEMVEIGAGGGSIARVDNLSRILVGPDSAGAIPGPACYGDGNTEPTVTDANLLLGRINPTYFAGGSIELDVALSETAITDGVANQLSCSPLDAAFGMIEVVDENMSNAARVHAVECGKELSGRTIIAFGGGAPLHAARLAEKLDIKEIIIPLAAGVGSAVGFLHAPVAYEVVRSHYMPLNEHFSAREVNELYAEMASEAEEIVSAALPKTKLVETRTADMRYRGQGHEITVALPNGSYGESLSAELSEWFDNAYNATYTRRIPGLEVEVINWTLRLSGPAREPSARMREPEETRAPTGNKYKMFNDETGEFSEVIVYQRELLMAGNKIAGPSAIIEEETTTIIPKGFNARVNAKGYIIMKKDLV